MLSNCLYKCLAYILVFGSITLKYQSDALYWISRFNNILKNIHEREDQENVFDELICLEKDGSLLKVQVDELLLVDVELKKACCRVKAWKVLRSKMPLESIQQVMDVASELQIGNEKVSDVLARAVCLEEKAKHVLACEVQMSEYEDVLRMSEDLCALVPSVDGVKGALLMAKSWLIKSKPYLVTDLSVMSDANSLLKVDDLNKELVLKSKLLKMCLEERSLLEDITKMESIMKAEYSLRFDSLVIPKLQETCAILQWCFIALNFHAVDPTLKEVLTLLEDAEKHHVAYASRPFWRSLVDGMNWLKKALEILGPCNDIKRFDLSDVKETLRQYKMIKISFSLIVDRLLDAVKRHNVWVEEVKSFFNCSSGDRSWSLLLQLERELEALMLSVVRRWRWLHLKYKR
ncbi:unnamed protein product [Lactuca virosa]|uniref:Lysine-specific demethylase-like domain-containing protein n=1 Tax=Lactuca virosa TaxID=75947 RepID=A0AAU9MTA3_9ASTR|nr:unnamed protein product [Lactuca virosa]